MMAIQILCAVVINISLANSFPQLCCPSRISASRGYIDDDVVSISRFAHRKTDTRTDFDIRRQRVYAKLPKVVSIIRRIKRKSAQPLKSPEIPISSILTELRNLKEFEVICDATNDEMFLQSVPHCDNSFENTTTTIDQGQATITKESSKLITQPSELQQTVLDDMVPLSEVNLKLEVANVSLQELLTHEVVELIVKRFHSQSIPGHRLADDTDILALSLEGGGMRGAVTAGMAAAIASLGLTNCFDRIYGSSAGSVIGAYMVR
jgi:Patatin-like phospholipase